MSTVRVEYTNRQILTVFVGLGMGMLLAALDQTIVATALPAITSDLGGLNHISWVITSYLVATTAAAPLYGRISDIFGRRPVFLFAIGVFLLGSLVAGVANNMLWFVGARFVQGLGAGGLMTLAMTVVGDIVPLEKRGNYQGILASVFGVASVLGPLTGGFFVDHLSWRWVFYVNIPLGLVAMAVVAATLHLPRPDKHESVDVLGAVLLTAGVSAAVLATSWGGTTYPWGSSQVFGAYLAAAVIAAIFFRVESRAASPILPLGLFNIRAFWMSAALMTVVGFALFGTISYLPAYLQVAKSLSATASGMLLVPMMLGVIVASTIAGKLMPKIPRYKVLPIFGLTIVSGTLIALTRISEQTGYVPVGIAMALMGIGMGTTMPVMMVVAQQAVERVQLGIATGTLSLVRSLGGAVGVAVGGTLFTGHLHSALGAAATRASSNPKAGGLDVNQIAKLPPALHQHVVAAFADASAHVFIASAPMALVGLLVAVLLPNQQLTARASDSKPADARAEHISELAFETGMPVTDGPIPTPAD